MNVKLWILCPLLNQNILLLLLNLHVPLMWKVYCHRISKGKIHQENSKKTITSNSPTLSKIHNGSLKMEKKSTKF